MHYEQTAAQLRLEVSFHTFSLLHDLRQLPARGVTHSDCTYLQKLRIRRVVRPISWTHSHLCMSSTCSRQRNSPNFWAPFGLSGVGIWFSLGNKGGVSESCSCNSSCELWAPIKSCTSSAVPKMQPKFFGFPFPIFPFSIFSFLGNFKRRQMREMRMRVGWEMWQVQKVWRVPHD